jgi:hypothetical protein
LAASKLALGVGLLFGVERWVPSEFPYLLGWVGMIGIIMVLHFGIFHLLSCGWRLPHTALERAPLVATKGRIDAPRRPAVVAGEDHQGLLREAMLANRVENLTDAPIHLFHPVREDAVRRLACPFFTRIDREVDRVVGEVQEERPRLVGLWDKSVVYNP